MAEEKKPSADIIAKWRKNVADPNVSEDIKSKFRNLLTKFGEMEVEVAREVEKVVTPKGTRGRKPSATKKPTARKPKEQVISISKEFDAKTGQIVSVKRVNGKVVKPKSTRGRKPSTPKSADDIEKAKADLKKKTGKTEEECQTIIEQYRALRTSAKKQDEKVKEATAENKTRINKLKKDDNLIEGTSVKTADATIETAKVEVVEKIEKEIEIVEAKVTEEVKKVVEKDTTLTPTEKKAEVKKVVDEKVKEKTKTIVKRVIVDTSALLTAISSKLGEFDKDSQKEFLIKLRSDIDKLLTKYAFGGLTSGATQPMNITQSNMSSSSVNSFGGGGGVPSVYNLRKGDKIKTRDGKIETILRKNKNGHYETEENDYTHSPETIEFVSRGGKSNYADGGLIEMFTANDDSDYVDDVLEQIKHMYSVDDYVLEQIVNDKGFDDVDELHMYFENAYFTYANSDADLGEEYVEMIGSISELGQDTLERYFDYKKFGLDLAYDYDEYSGHYFNQGYKQGGVTKSRFDNGGGVGKKLSFKEFSETLRDNDRISAYTGKTTTGMEMYYLPSGHSSLGRKFNHKNKRKAYQEYLASAKFDNGGDVDGGYLTRKGYEFPREVYFEVDGEYYEVIQAQKGLKEIGIYYYTDAFENQITKKVLDKISNDFGKDFNITLFTNVGVDLHSSSKGKYKNITIERIKSMYSGGGIVVFDNEGESYDRYTIFTPDGSVYGMSDNPMSPNGFNQYLGDNTEITMGSHLGKRLKSVPDGIYMSIIARLKEQSQS